MSGMIVQVTLFTLALWGLLFVSTGSTFIDLEPSIGDVRLYKLNPSDPDDEWRGFVEIYFTDGVHEPGWGRICAEDSLTSTAIVVCRQLGYQSGDLNEMPRPLTGEVPIISNNTPSPIDQHRTWLTGVQCGHEDTTFTHILQCGYKVLTSDDKTCSNDYLLNVSCRGNNYDGYDGQVRLCSPSVSPSMATSGKVSVSMGLVQIYLNGDWGQINQYNLSHPLGSHEADSICRQMGYTNAVATITQGAASIFMSSATVNVSFDPKCYTQTNTKKQAWLMTDNATCDHSESCFGCCFTYPEKLCPSTSCDRSRDMVIRCTFDPTIHKNGWEGSSHRCGYKDHKIQDPSSCNQQDFWLHTFEITVGVVGSVAFILFIALIVVTSCFCYWWHRRNRQPRPQGPGQQHLLRHHQDDEN